MASQSPIARWVPVVELEELERPGVRAGEVVPQHALTHAFEVLIPGAPSREVLRTGTCLAGACHAAGPRLQQHRRVVTFIDDDVVQ